jgi:hypothetical protein
MKGGGQNRDVVMMVDQFGRAKKLSIGGVRDPFHFQFAQEDVELFEEIRVGLVFNDAAEKFTGDLFENDLRDQDAKK